MARGFAKLHTLGSPCGRRHPGSSVPRVAIASPPPLPVRCPVLPPALRAATAAHGRRCFHRRDLRCRPPSTRPHNREPRADPRPPPAVHDGPRGCARRTRRVPSPSLVRCRQLRRRVPSHAAHRAVLPALPRRCEAASLTYSPMHSCAPFESTGWSTAWSGHRGTFGALGFRCSPAPRTLAAATLRGGERH